MTLTVKICGITGAAAMDAAVEGGARYVGLMFYPPSPRFLSLDAAAGLAARVPAGITRVGVFVDPVDALLVETLARVPLDALQLHGGETPRRLAEIRARFSLPIIKAVKIAGPEDLAHARAHEAAADILLFDAKPPAEMTHALPGGNALSFDWRIIAGESWSRPWMLSGGLDAGNLAEAVAISGARMVDVSSGVESTAGVKDPALIRAFLARAAAI
ncbi:MAG: phosphoribosylanthranilate isomerase [Alphaproteobacteria bacterium]|nr:phosphoribosylanthranilate isomerase [Alphaproteobacteria bacterium]